MDHPLTLLIEKLTTEAMKSITQLDLMNFIQLKFAKSSPQRRKLSIHITPGSHHYNDTLNLGDCGRLISDLDEWKQTIPEKL